MTEHEFKSNPCNANAVRFNITYGPRNFCVWNPINPTDRFSDYRADLQAEYKDWLNTNCRYPWALITTYLSEQAMLCFMDSDDAMLFKLTWL